MRTHNIYANRAAPSQDIAKSFAVLEHLGLLCSGGITTSTDRPAGTGLVQLFHSDEVQTFVNGATAKALHPEKVIYQVGILRKKQTTPLKLRDLKVTIGDSLVTLQQLPTFVTLELPPGITLDKPVTAYGGVISQQEELVQHGEYIHMVSDGTQAQYALLLACVAKEEHWFCLVRVMEELYINNEHLTV